MDELLLRTFRFEVITQANIAISAWNQLLEFAKLTTDRTLPEEVGRRMLEAVAPFQSFLVAAGVISLILFPKPKGTDSPRARNSIARGAELRMLWAVSDDSPLRDRRLRNSLEHIDERLEEWVERRTDARLSPFAVVLDPNQVRAQGGESIRILVGKVPWRFIVAGEEQETQVLVEAIRDLAERIGPNQVTGYLWKAESPGLGNG